VKIKHTHNQPKAELDDFQQIPRAQIRKKIVLTNFSTFPYLRFDL